MGNDQGGGELGNEVSGQQAKSSPRRRVSKAGASSRAEDATVASAHNARSANGPENGGNGGNRPSRNLLRRPTTNEWLTLLVAVGSLVVSYMTYRNVADTTDIKNAIGNLSELAAQSKNQAGIMQGQLDEMRAEQRPWVALATEYPEILGELNIGATDATVRVRYSVKNFGHSPALSVHIHSALRLKVAADEKVDCNSADRIPTGEQTLVPGASIVWEESAITSRDDWDALQKARRREEEDYPSTPRLLGCIEYKFADGSEHHTRFGFTLSAKGRGFNLGGDSVGPDRIKIEVSPIGDLSAS